MNAFKRIAAISLSIFMLFGIANGASVKLPAAFNIKAEESVKINKTKATVLRGNSITLKILNTTSAVKWSADNKNVSFKKINDYSITVTAKKKGTTTVTAEADGSKYTCVLTIKPKYSDIEGTITYYNKKKNKNYKDSYAVVILVNQNGMAKNIQINSIYVWGISGSRYFKERGIYIDIANSGKYSFEDIPAGTYRMFIVSSRAFTQSGEATDNNKKKAAESMTKYTNEIAGDTFGEFVNFSCFADVSKKLKNKTTVTYDYNFK